MAASKHRVRDQQAPNAMTTALDVITPSAKLEEEALTDYMRAERIVDAINAVLPEGKRQLKKIPKEFVFHRIDREAVSIAFHSAFANIGGLPALVQWAAHNPDKFYPLYAKLLPSETMTPAGATSINFISAVPANPLDRVNVNTQGQVFIEAEEALPE